MPTRRRTGIPPRDPRQRMIAAALELAASQGWRRTGLGEIAAAAHLPLAEAYALFRSKAAILAGFRHGVDAVVLAGPTPSANESARDRLFDVLMRRLDALKPHRPALRAILRDSIGDPAAVKSAIGLHRSMMWMLTAAGLPSTGCRGRLACRLVTAVYLSIFPVFFRDESGDLGSTMATLDKRLRQVEQVIAMVAPLAHRTRAARKA